MKTYARQRWTQKMSLITNIRSMKGQPRHVGLKKQQHLNQTNQTNKTTTTEEKFANNYVHSHTSSCLFYQYWGLCVCVCGGGGGGLLISFDKYSCTLHLFACQVRVTVGDSGLCSFVRLTSFQRLLNLRCVDLFPSNFGSSGRSYVGSVVSREEQKRKSRKTGS